MIIQILSHVNLIRILDYKVSWEKGFSHQLLGDTFIFSKDEITAKEFCVFGSPTNNSKVLGTFIITQNDEYIKIEESTKKS